jgi:hypothetical protein
MKPIESLIWKRMMTVGGCIVTAISARSNDALAGYTRSDKSRRLFSDGNIPLNPTLLFPMSMSNQTSQVSYEASS